MFAAQSLQNHRKGTDLLLAALADQDVSRDIGLVSVGMNQLSVAVPGGHYALGELNSERLMSFAYSAADLFVLPAREDNLPNVVLEHSPAVRRWSRSTLAAFPIWSNRM